MRKRLVIAALLTACTTLWASAAYSIGWPGSKLSVSPSAHLLEGESVKVKATGLQGFSTSPQRFVHIVECKADATDSTHCGYINANGPSTALLAILTNGSTLNTRYPVTRQFWTEWEYVDCTQPPGCTIGVVDPRTAYLGPTTPISFAP